MFDYFIIKYLKNILSYKLKMAFLLKKSISYKFFTEKLILMFFLIIYVGFQLLWL